MIYYLIGTPVIGIWLAVSCQTVMNHHFRYVLPSLGLVVIAASQVGNCKHGLQRICVLVLGLWAGLSSVFAAPNFIAYFNEFAAGKGHQYLLHSNVDFGQDLFKLREWSLQRTDDLPLYVSYYGYIDPIDYGVRGFIAPFGPIKKHNPVTSRFERGWYAISLNYVYGSTWGLGQENPYVVFGKLNPAGRCGASILLFRIDETLEAERSKFE